MLIIYGSPISSPTNKVRYVANYLKIPFDFKRINLAAGEQRQENYLKTNPYGRIPAIDDDGFTLAESNAIMRYLANKTHSELYPQELQKRAIVDQWIDYASQHVLLALSRVMFNTYFYKLARVEKDERSLQDGYKFINQYLPVIENQLKHHSFITGDSFTLADIALLAGLDVVELAEVDLSPYPHIVQWRKQLMSEKFYKDCHESYESAFNSIMKTK